MRSPNGGVTDVEFDPTHNRPTGVPLKPQFTLAVVLLAGFQGGGTERVVASLVRHGVCGRDVRFVLITNRGPEHDRYPTTLDVERKLLNVDIDESSFASKGVLRALPRVVTLVWRARRAIRDSGATAVLSMLTTSNLATLAATVGLRSTRVVVSERNDTTQEPLPRPLRLARRCLYRRADLVTANVERSLDDMRRYVAPARLRFVPNSVEVPDWEVDVATKRVLFVGRMVVQKDPVAAVDGFARACADPSAGQVDGWQLAMVGDGPLMDQVRTEIDRRSIGHRVTLTGFLPDVRDQFRSASIFVMTSQFEGTPNALLEAMAAGHACVVSDALPGALRYIEDEVSGLVYRHGDIEHLAGQLRRMMDDEELRQRLGRQARRRMGALAPEVVASTWMSLLVPEA